MEKVTRRRALIAGASGMAVVALACCGIEGHVAYDVWRDETGQKNPDQIDRDTSRIRPEKFDSVAKAAHLVLPPGCVWIDGYYYYWQEWMIAARFTVPRDQLDAFVTGSALPRPQAGLRPNDVMSAGNPASKHDPGWHPELATDVSGAFDLHMDVYRHVLFDLGQKDGIAVYLIAGDAR